MTRLVGVVHLGPLPGSPRQAAPLTDVIAGAIADAGALAEAGFDAVIVENFGDAPFFAGPVPPVTVSSITRALTEIGQTVEIPLGVNVLRNDALAAMSVAAATGAAFIRVNVLTGQMITDQGPIVGQAAQVTRLRRQLDANVEIWADVMVKHAVPPPGLAIEDAAADAVTRGLADRLIVTGKATGASAHRDTIRRVGAAGAPVMVGSGATVQNVAGLLEVADGVIVGTAIKKDGVTTNAVDATRAAAFVEAAGR